MKKLFLSFLFTIFLLNGCSNKQNTAINHPYEIKSGDNSISYYDTKIHSYFSNNYSIVQNENNKIRSITINDKNATTINNLSIGDSITAIENSFNNEYKSGNNYFVIFNDEIEEDPTSQKKEDDWIWINYITDGSQITQIQIYDVKFGRDMK